MAKGTGFFYSPSLKAHYADMARSGFRPFCHMTGDPLEGSASAKLRHCAGMDGPDCNDDAMLALMATWRANEAGRWDSDEGEMEQVRNDLRVPRMCPTCGRPAVGDTGSCPHHLDPSNLEET